jgi:hypothetical protein
VDEALVVGWIDGIRKRIDGQRYKIRFTPRRRGSVWSAINIVVSKARLLVGRQCETRGDAQQTARQTHRRLRRRQAALTGSRT